MESTKDKTLFEGAEIQPRAGHPNLGIKMRCNTPVTPDAAISLPPSLQ